MVLGKHYVKTLIKSVLALRNGGVQANTLRVTTCYLGRDTIPEALRGSMYASDESCL